MNLVVDDAVEVKMATKDTEESRRELGALPVRTTSPGHALTRYRTNSAQGRQRRADTKHVGLSGRCPAYIGNKEDDRHRGFGMTSVARYGQSYDWFSHNGNGSQLLSRRGNQNAGEMYD